MSGDQIVVNEHYLDAAPRPRPAPPSLLLAGSAPGQFWLWILVTDNAGAQSIRVQYTVELQTKVREDFTITEKAPSAG